MPIPDRPARRWCVRRRQTARAPNSRFAHRGGARPLSEVALFACREQVVLARHPAGYDRHDVVDVQDHAGCVSRAAAVAAAEAVASEDPEAELGGGSRARPVRWGGGVRPGREEPGRRDGAPGNAGDRRRDGRPARSRRARATGTGEGNRGAPAPQPDSEGHSSSARITVQPTTVDRGVAVQSRLRRQADQGRDRMPCLPIRRQTMWASPSRTGDPYSNVARPSSAHVIWNTPAPPWTPLTRRSGRKPPDSRSATSFAAATRMQPSARPSGWRSHAGTSRSGRTSAWPPVSRRAIRGRRCWRRTSSPGRPRCRRMLRALPPPTPASGTRPGRRR